MDTRGGQVDRDAESIGATVSGHHLLVDAILACPAVPSSTPGPAALGP